MLVLGIRIQVSRTHEETPGAGEAEVRGSWDLGRQRLEDPGILPASQPRLSVKSRSTEHSCVKREGGEQQ